MLIYYALPVVAVDLLDQVAQKMSIMQLHTVMALAVMEEDRQEGLLSVMPIILIIRQAEEVKLRREKLLVPIL
jgi:hypothetical protein